MNRPAAYINQINFCASPRSKFKTDAAGSAKQVKYFNKLKIEMVGQNIKKCNLGEIGSRPYIGAF